jgi:hypothetical protein
MDIIGVPMAQFGAAHPRGEASTQGTANSTVSSGERLFCPAKWATQKNTSGSDDISAVTMPLIDKFPNATTTKALMAHSNLRYDEIRVGNKGVCLNYNLFGVCRDKSCSYRHTKAKPTQERINAVANKLKPAIQSFMVAGAPASNTHAKKRKRDGST